MFTYDWPPEREGQQLMVRGTRASSLLCIRHFRIPSSLPVGNGREGSLRPSMLLELYAALSMLGCVLNWKPRFAPELMATRTNASSSLLTTSDIVPWTSRFSSPPSLFRCTLSFSSMSMVQGSVVARAAGASPPPIAMPPAGPVAGLGASTSTASPSLASDSRNSLAFFALPSCMPLDGPRGAGAVGLDTTGSGRTPKLGLVLLSMGSGRSSWLKAGRWALVTLRLSNLTLSISIAFFFMMSLVSLILLWMIILCSFSSWLSISQFCLTCNTVVFSLCPREMTSSKAKMRSKALMLTASSSSRPWQNSGTSLDTRRSVSRSSRMLLCLLVTSNTYKPSMGWYT
mmetsp:Transcript_18197/g.50982  ORF Transcript_18197/g.50982 Transcript_18197/m.50982 type:complete len:343 (-) Transcript_18197:325-1353(-)